MSAYYDIAQICLNGHVTNDSYKTYPKDNKNYCDICGEKTITSCSKCCKDIRGRFIGEHISGFDKTPKFCEFCGQAFPWTEKAINATLELVELEGILSEKENEIFVNSLNDVVKDTHTSEVSATKMKLLMKKFGKVTYDTVFKLIVDISSESIKKMMVEP